LSGRTDTHTGQIAGPGPLEWSEKWHRTTNQSIY